MSTLTAFIRTIPARIELGRHRRWLIEGKVVNAPLASGRRDLAVVTRIDYQTKQIHLVRPAVGGGTDTVETLGFDLYVGEHPIKPTTRRKDPLRRDLLGRMRPGQELNHWSDYVPEPLIYRLCSFRFSWSKTQAYIGLSYILTGHCWVTTEELDVSWWAALRRLAREARW